MDPDFVSKQLFVVTVAAATIVPRMPFDECMSLGGNLSRGFRCLMLMVALSNVARNTILRHWLDLHGYKEVNLVLFALECMLTSFMCLIIPYLLRTYLSDRINFPGRDAPGKGLMVWVYYVIFAISLTGVSLRLVTGDEDWWVLKKVGDALTVIPVLQTLSIYDRISTSQAAHPGRGTVMSQAIRMVELYVVAVHGTDIFIRGLKILEIADYTNHVIYFSMYSTSNHYAVFTRTLTHSMLLNVMDEGTVCFTPQPSVPEGENGNSEEESPPATVVDIESERALLVN